VSEKNLDKPKKKYENPVERIWYGSTPKMVNLTPRELEIVYWVAHGLRNAEISEMMHGRPAARGCESHVRNILCKIGLKSRVQIALWAAKHGIIDLEKL
jgi:DNA-binding CsgD family transcriptional regulator